MAVALDNGLVARALADSWAQRADDIAHRRAPLTGVSEYPHLTEVRPTRTPSPAALAAGTGAGLPVHRYAEQFEALRDRADARMATHGTRPTVFLATLGPIAAHSARAAFATNLFAAGGIATVASGPATDPDELATLFAASGARLACLCGNDSSYAALAEPAARALASAGATVWLAGRPAGYDAVSGYLHAGMDAVAALASCLDLLAD
jgi:methylmalonyl-CoA mutase